MAEDIKNVEYTKRYCAFVDILGFSELINRLSQGATNATALRDLLKIIHRPPAGNNIRSFSGSDLRAQSISDAVCLSAAHSKPGLGHLLHNIEALALLLLRQGFFIRGAVVAGSLYHDEATVFGEALVRAYRLEQDTVKFPRIMVTRDVVSDIGSYQEAFDWETPDVIQADDGPFFLDILSLPALLLHTEQKPDYRQIYVDEYNQFATQIQRRFNEAVDYPRHFEKVQWFASYWNRTLWKYKSEISMIKGPGIDPRAGKWGQ